uniref:Radial spoke head 3 n=1 Tax=Takifugu rubripes TaxID=31033 RepID=A0A3B5KEH1_TAKRU
MAFVSYNQMEQNRSYTFLNRPRPVESRPIYRKPSAERTLYQFGNITYDRRVVRGNVFAQNIISAKGKLDPSVVERQQGVKPSTGKRPRGQTSRALPGRTHIDVQTEPYLYEMSDVIETSDSDCQTDPFLDIPSAPLFRYARIGNDVGTVIEEGELFDFDREVAPMLSNLVGKVVEQSLMEVMEEEEVACLKAQQRAFEELQNFELAEMKRLEEQERRRRQEKEHRMAQQRDLLRREREVAEKLAKQADTLQYISDLLKRASAPKRPPERDVESNFMPWLTSETDNYLDKRNAARELLDSIILDMAQKSRERLKDLETQTSESE